MSNIAALMRRNMILMRRNKYCCCEIFTPILMTFMLALLRKTVSIDHFEAQSYEPIPTFQGPILNRMPNYTIRDCQAFKNQSMIALSPTNDSIVMELETYFKKIRTKNSNMKEPQTDVQIFDSNQDINDYMRADDYEDYKPVCFAININNSSSYSLRFEMYGNPYKTPLPNPSLPEMNPTQGSDVEVIKKWIKTGFLGLQALIDSFIIQQETQQKVVLTPYVTSMYEDAHVKDLFSDYTSGSFGLFYVLPLMSIYLRLAYQLLYDKQMKLREVMLMMGLKDHQYFFSWIFTYMIYYFFVTIIIVSISHFAVFKNISWIVLFMLYYGFCLVLTVQSLFITIFFSNSLIGLIVAIVFYLSQYLFVLLLSSDSTTPESTIWLVNFFPHSGIQMAFDNLISYQVQQTNYSFKNTTELVNNYKLQMTLSMNFINILIYLVLTLYLDQVWPNEWGSKKHPLFCCMKKKSIINDSTVEASQFESVTNVLSEQSNQKQTLSLKNLQKVYDNGKKAVHGITLEVYLGQIFVLLGHNGAGKTTTISMLTGLVEPSAGTIEAFGKTDQDAIRQFLGICPQQNTLFDMLTVREHLELFGRFKCSKDPVSEAQSMIAQLDLLDKGDCLSKDLSGGQKRRLLVGMAFMGDSKLVILDEPTSGMDTSARRYIWTLLKNLKQDRIVILTTHFMDEADYLGDRIGIMSSGRLVCCGSSNWLKNKYGDGYTLTILKQPSVQFEPIIQMVEQKVSEAKILSKVSAEIQFQLPMDQVAYFPDLFIKLEQHPQMVRDFAVSITTLEEVFLKVALQTGEANHKKNNLSLNDGSFHQPPNLSSLFVPHTKILIKKRINYMKRDFRSVLCEILLPCVVVLAGLIMLNTQSVTEPPKLTIQQSIFPIVPQYYYAGEYQNQLNMTYMNNQNLSQVDQNYSANLSQYGVGWFYIDTLSNYSIFANTKYKDSPPFMLNKMSNQYTPIQVTFDPLPYTQKQYSIAKTITGIGALFTFTLGLSFIPASIVSFVVKEKEVAMKHQQLVSGVSVGAYWFAHIIVDFTRNLIPTLWSIAMIKAFEVSSMIDDGAYACVFALFFLYGSSIGPFCYLVSFIFNFEGNAMLSCFFLNIVLGTIIPLVIYILRLIESTRSVARVLQWIFRIFPSFSFGYGLLNVTSIKVLQSIEGTNNIADIKLAGGDILMMVLMMIIDWVLVFTCEYAFTTKKVGTYVPPKVKDKPKRVLDSDVQEEKDLLKKAAPIDYPLLVRNLSKTYSTGKRAVDKISFKVSQGEVFGLLGVNGAGKSSTFKMLSGENKPSSGKCWVSGFSSDDPEARRHIGYCPQFDALLDKLTVREHLELFSTVKGVPSVEETISRMLRILDLERFADVNSCELSGGNKRKLSVGIAMIGNPPVVLLDEPSSGMDPEARRFMWDLIAKCKDISIVLTTHSMEEAEALSTRLAIMVDGQFKCLGSIPHIKSKYGGGYELEVKILMKQSDTNTVLLDLGLSGSISKDQLQDLLAKKYPQLKLEDEAVLIELKKSNNIKSLIVAEWIAQETLGNAMLQYLQQELMSNITVIEHFNTFYRLKFENLVPLSNLFRILEIYKANQKISYYSIKQTSLESIFNNFANGTAVVNISKPKSTTSQGSNGGSVSKIQKDFSVPQRPQLFVVNDQTLERPMLSQQPNMDPYNENYYAPEIMDDYLDSPEQTSRKPQALQINNSHNQQIIDANKYNQYMNL